MRVAAVVAMLCLLAGGMVTCLTVNAHAAATQAPPILERTIAVPNVSVHIGCIAVDLRCERLFVNGFGNETVDVVAVVTGDVIHRVGRLLEPQGIGYAPAADIIAVANAGGGTLQLFGGKDFAPAGSIELRDDAGNVRVDPRSGKFQ